MRWGKMKPGNLLLWTTCVGHCLLLICLHCTGPRSREAFKKLGNQNECHELLIKQIEQEVLALERQITRWDKDPFYKEKQARERLQMARLHDEIYRI